MARTDRVWQRVLDGAFRHDDDLWRLGDGGEWLLDLLLELLHPDPDDPEAQALTEDQLVRALDKLQAEAER